MVKFMADVPKESWVEVSGEVQAPRDQSGNRVPITGTSQQVRGLVYRFLEKLVFGNLHKDCIQ